jgi:predicted phosphodiesterase
MSSPARPLFRFAVIADSHINPSDDDLISPYASHRLTNERMEHTVRTLNALAPAFVMHVGDMVHPVPEAVSYPQAVQRFRRTLEGLSMPLHPVAGNHDIGDKLADYVPAGSIRPEYVEQYRAHFGPDFHSFDVHDCHFVAINTSLINSGLALEQAQRDWLQADLRAHAGRRIFLFVHYPPYIAHADEHGHYDNIDEPGRSWLLALLREHRIAAVFTGHVHNFFFNQHGDTPIFSLPSTAFVRSDYSEMFAIGQPAEHENGRNDTAKLAIVAVDVYADRIVPQFIRTFALDDAGGAAVAQRDWPQLPPAAGARAGLGIDLRHSWTALHDIPYSSMLDEFRRKQARNDYPVMGLWELGIRHLRVPLDDLLQPSTRQRMQAMAAQGTRFTVFLFGWPDDATQALLAAHAPLLAALELVLKWPLAEDLPQRLGALQARCGLPLHVSRFWSAAGQSRDGKQIKLLVDHGFRSQDDAALADLAPSAQAHAVAAAVFRIASSEAAPAGIAQARAAAQALCLRAQVHVRLASDSPAQGQLDAVANGERVLQTALCAHAWPEVDVFIDTLTDVERGYFPRAGLLDRRYNPHPAGHALRNLHGLLSTLPKAQVLQWSQQGALRSGLLQHAQGQLQLLLPGAQPLPADARPALTVPAQTRWDLQRGTCCTPDSADWQAPLDGPTLFLAKA